MTIKNFIDQDSKGMVFNVQIEPIFVNQFILSFPVICS